MVTISSISSSDVVLQPRRRQHAARVSRVDAGLLDVLHDRGDERLAAVAEGVDVELERALEEPVDEDARAWWDAGSDRLGVVADDHLATAEHVRRTDEDRVADPLGHADRLRLRARHPPRRHLDAEVAAEGAEPLAVLGEVDGIERRPQDPEAGLLDRARQLERRLASELDHDADGLLALADRQHFLDTERLEVEPVRGVVVGRDRLRVAVDHHGLEAELAEAARRVDAAVVELDALTDPVRAGAEDDDAPPGRRKFIGLAPGRVVVGRSGLDLAGAGVDPPVGGPDAPGAPLRPHELLGGPAMLGDRRVRPPRALDPHPVVRDERVERAHAAQRLAGRLELGFEPRMQVARLPPVVELARPLRLEERLAERAPDPHRLADGLHLRAERAVGARELLEGEAGELDDDVVERRLEARRRGACQVVRDLVERVADRELCGDLGDRIARRLRRERGGAGNPRVHLDHAQRARLAVPRELDVRAARLDPDGADDRGGGIAELLVRLVRQRHLRRDRHRVAGVHAHRVEVLDRADDHDVVVAVAHDLELVLVPADERLLDEHLADRALVQAAVEQRDELVLGMGRAAAVASEGERRSEHDREGQLGRDVVPARHDRGGRDPVAGESDGVAEELAVLGAPDHVQAGADQLDPELGEHACLGQLEREVERRLAAERREQGVGPLPFQHSGHAVEIERLDVRPVGESGVGHDRRRVGVDDDGAEAVLPQHLQRLAARVVELARLTDHDRPGADHADGREVRPPWQGPRTPPRPRSRAAARRRGGQGPPPGGTAPTGRRGRGSRALRRCRRTATRASPLVLPRA